VKSILDPGKPGTCRLDPPWYGVVNCFETSFLIRGTSAAGIYPALSHFSRHPQDTSSLLVQRTNHWLSGDPRFEGRTDDRAFYLETRKNPRPRAPRGVTDGRNGFGYQTENGGSLTKVMSGSLNLKRHRTGHPKPFMPESKTYRE
jgi:hypothetical protein